MNRETAAFLPSELWSKVKKEEYVGGYIGFRVWGLNSLKGGGLYRGLFREPEKGPIKGDTGSSDYNSSIL